MANFVRPKDYEGDIPEYKLIDNREITNPDTGETRIIKFLIDMSDDEIIEARVKKLKIKLIRGEASDDEIKELSLLK